jgi:ERI1 exoribonuclease 3
LFLKLLDKWIKKNNDLVFNEESQNFIFITCGDWDLRTMLPTQCNYFNIKYPVYLRSWINLKKSFAEITAHFPKGMMTMLDELGLKHTGWILIFFSF